jgi:hypothetical protein
MGSAMQHTDLSSEPATSTAIALRDPEPPAAAVAAPGVNGAERWVRDTLGYQRDFWQRSVLFLDILRERANNMLDHEQAGLPSLLDFPYEMILDARTFDKPANYALLLITATSDPCFDACADESKPPVIVVDPRAGHGPGIGGFKRDSEVGIALHEGHPVYFVIFFPQPCTGQTLADVHHALRRFVAEVAKRHPGKAPVLYGNCQGGWAVALLAADCVGLAGPVVMNGSPLSYWAGESGVNPARLAGGLLGGAWLAHFTADLSGGVFDGAWLAQNFEGLNPAHALWDKNYAVLADPEAERERFLKFERWWSGFYSLGREEIVSIVENLFVGNRLEQGVMRICECCFADLKRIRNPIVVFASSGDNITPPHQALNWVPEVYPSTDDLKQAGQRIVYLLNPHVGHLGIFVSAAVAKFEHRAILESLPEIEALTPGLYEMKIVNPTGDPNCRKDQYEVRFEARRVEDIRFNYPRDAFERVRAVSEWNEWAYSSFVSPWVRAFATPMAGEWLKWLHPMRISRYAFSERVSPWMAAVAPLAAQARANRQPADAANPFLQAERLGSLQVSSVLGLWREAADQGNERMFALLYGPLPGAGATDRSGK